MEHIRSYLRGGTMLTLKERPRRSTTQVGCHWALDHGCAAAHCQRVQRSWFCSFTRLRCRRTLLSAARCWRRCL